MMLLNKTRCVQVRCSSEKKPENPIVNARKRFERKRFATVKDNFNKLVVVGSSEVKEVQEFFQELDELHKKEFDKWFKQDDTTVEVTTINEDNIFVE